MTHWILQLLGLAPRVFYFKDSPSPPAAPAPVDPSVQIAAQAKALPSVYSPFGTAVYSGDPNVSGSFRQDITLSPEQQDIYNRRTGVAQALLWRGGKALGEMPTNYRYGGKSLPDTFQWEGAKDPAANRFFTAQKALLDPVWKVNEERERQRLSNQGIPEGSEAYNEAMRQFALQRDSAYEQASANALDKGYSQALSTRGQQYNEANQAFSQDISQRQQNLNEIAQALGGSQLTPVGGGAQPIDVGSAYAASEASKNRAYQGQLAGYNADVASQNSQMGGLFSLGAAALPFLISDRRLKRDINLLGEIWPGVGWYAFRYLWDAKDAPLRHGVMADEIERVIPEAVIWMPEGYAMVDYGRLFEGRTVH